MPMITLVGAITAVFQPSFFPLATLQTLYFQAFITGIKAFGGMDESSASRWEHAVDQIVFPFYMIVYVAVPCVVCFLGWLLSASIVFAVIYVPLSLIAAIEIMMVFGGITLLRWILDNCGGKTEEEIEVYESNKRHDLDADDQKDTAVGTKLDVREWMNLKISKTIRDSLWWADGMADGSGNKPFQWTIRLALVLYAIAPLVVYGTCLALYVYNVESMELHTDFIRWSYQYTFSVFSSIEIRFPSFFFDLSLVPEALSYIKGFLWSVSRDPKYYLQGSAAVTGLNFLLSIIKPLTTYGPKILNFAIKASGCVPVARVEEIPFSRFVQGRYKFIKPDLSRFKKVPKVTPVDDKAADAVVGASFHNVTSRAS